MAIILVLFCSLSLPLVVLAENSQSMTAAGTVATVSAQNKAREVDLTVPKEEGDRLTLLMKSQKVTGWWVTNSLKLAIRKAVSEGVSPNTLVLLFLFPLVAALVAFSRQVVGVNGFGMIIPALLSVAFVSTGGVVGLVLLSFVMLSAIFGRMAIRKIKIPYLPKLAVLIWLISISVLGLLIMSPTIGLERLMSVGIFPIMIFVLLAETFIEAQITRSVATSMGMTLETIILAFIAYKVMSSSWIQNQVLLQPELSVVLILVLDLLIGKYKGLRFSEVWRFRKLLSK
ncbi:MAG: hypothetical protein UW64_C0027G0013 [Microgenomates group bacterium GW2011_GWC1_44_37]|uniref:7 transmembrane helices usually fused to an inactive transglutaminase domain-containing protein n=1 Tax=Candidatus Collierbacteria bacterium GW2011_GWB2_44_22 TaxID=1618387 RepID=A0A0G1HWU9_9BACT|nr:MAG: hypothetical protein UW31_C0003G0064 [Candidatus Collierbacteria bacterium GW2011_GWA2_44_13]KKT51103.1 MAG: hypothetical protein UW44_C0016G0014 [Candidatus Collierbacteria bacterium GW2011_GWB2_44_22]KKT61967.1 MAG: hypothetical protein UW56_C0014G0012 [Candidatus Collierbacteria bacterium GW2011_GWD1_44_27]KKT65589.1 MAG: hypothetical protein UW58_C0025G0003 [Candidatus Collierbacteria bacterium GW2011_GWC2_44_30]KKT68183.1 MAG: hypothetical protein UW64_C0027G0013 [Microgenomates gr